MAIPKLGINRVTCRRCGQTVERSKRCSNCGSKLSRISSRALWKGLLFTAAAAVLTTGVLYSRTREPRLISVGSIKPYMNFRTVRIEGELVKPAQQLKSGAVFYLVDDGTGRLAVFAPMPENKKLYWAGSRIKAAGSLRAGIGNNTSLQAAEVELLETPAYAGFESEVMLADIRADKEGDTVSVQGVVSKVWKPKAGSKAPHKIILEDPSGQLSIIHWLEQPPELDPGDPIEVTGAVQVYQGRVELRVFDKEAVRLVGKTDAAPVELEIGRITHAMEKQLVIAEGVLGFPRSIPGGVIYPFTDGSGTIQLLFWDKNVTGEERDALDEGVQVRVEAPVVVYKGILELVPEDAGGFKVLD